jgi:hypothetical protein
MIPNTLATACVSVKQCESQPGSFQIPTNKERYYSWYPIIKGEDRVLQIVTQ